MKGLLVPLSDGRYEIRGFAVDEAASMVLVFAALHATHASPGGPVAPTGKAVSADYVYAIEFREDGAITHMTKIWNDAHSLGELGWA